MVVVIILDFDFPALRALLCNYRKAIVCLHSTSVFATPRLIGFWVFGISIFASLSTSIVYPLIFGRRDRDSIAIVSGMALKSSFYSLWSSIYGFVKWQTKGRRYSHCVSVDEVRGWPCGKRRRYRTVRNCRWESL